MITQKELKRILYYDPLTGCFIRKIATGKRWKIGEIVGTITTNGGKKYLKLIINKKNYYAHRLAWLYMTGSFPKDQTDHWDGNGLNNKWNNLSEATNQINSKNHRLRIDNTTGYVGISWCKIYKKWHARIWDNKKKIHLGYFTKIKDAIRIRKAAEKKYGYHLNHGQTRPL